MKLYEVKINGIAHTMQFADGQVPKGAVEVKAKGAPKNKAKPAPKNKAKDAPKNKAADKSEDEKQEANSESAPSDSDGK